MMTDTELRRLQKESRELEEYPPLSQAELAVLRAEFRERMAKEMAAERKRLEAERWRMITGKEEGRKARRDRDANCLLKAAESAQLTLAEALHGTATGSYELVPVFKDYQGVVAKLADRRRYLEKQGADPDKCLSYQPYFVDPHYEWEFWGR